MEGISSLVIFISGPNLLILLHMTLDKFEFKMCQNNKNLTNAKVDRVNQKSSSAPTNVIQQVKCRLLISGIFLMNLQHFKVLKISYQKMVLESS